jgi:hypothetical protein
MAKTVSERTFTAELSMRRDAREYTDEYDVMSVDGTRCLATFAASDMPSDFRGINQLLPVPAEHAVGECQRIRMTIEVLPEETPKTPQG